MIFAPKANERTVTVMLTLPIKAKWYRMILSGEKKEEYREIKPYWTTRIENAFRVAVVNNDRIIPWEILNRSGRKPEQKIRLRCGYQRKSHTAVARVKLRIGTGRQEWGAEPGRLYYIFKILEAQEELRQNEAEKTGDSIQTE